KLLKVREAKKGHGFRVAVTPGNGKKPPLAFADEQDRQTLEAVKTYSFVEIDKPLPGPKVRVLASFDETTFAEGDEPTRAGIALLDHRPIAGGGPVVLLTTTVN